jgi:hypothetical protein
MLCEADMLATRIMLKSAPNIFSDESFFYPPENAADLQYKGRWPEPTDEMLDHLLLSFQ